MCEYCNSNASIDSVRKVYGNWGMRKLETNTKGTLYLHSMPGRREELSDFIDQAEKRAIEQIICLTAEEEIAEKSPHYGEACKTGSFPVPRKTFPVPDFGVPADTAAFYQLVDECAGKLKDGKNILVHCAGGIGRTGMFAGTELMALGLPLSILEESGSYPEEDEQMQVIQKYPLSK